MCTHLEQDHDTCHFTAVHRNMILPQVTKWKLKPSKFREVFVNGGDFLFLKVHSLTPPPTIPAAESLISTREVFQDQNHSHQWQLQILKSQFWCSNILLYYSLTKDYRVKKNILISSFHSQAK